MLSLLPHSGFVQQSEQGDVLHSAFCVWSVIGLVITVFADLIVDVRFTRSSRVFDVLHPIENRLISYSEYLTYALDNDFKNANLALGGRCPVCSRRMKVRAGQTKSDGHFYHNDDLFCPSKDPSSRPYVGLTPTTIDPVAVQRNRSFANDNVDVIWQRLKEIVPLLDFKEFINILQEARRLNIYGYVGLEPSLLPYVYVTLINFLPSKSVGKKRKLKFCFFYESSIHSLDDLWINTGDFSRLSRISYSKGLTKKVTLIETSMDYLENNIRKLTPKQLAWCLREM